MKGQTRFGMPRGANMNLALHNRYRMFFVKTSTLTPCMHQKLDNTWKFCKQNNQLPTKSYDELKDNSIMNCPKWAKTPYQTKSF